MSSCIGVPSSNAAALQGTDAHAHVEPDPVGAFFGAVLVALLPAAQGKFIRGLALFHAGLALALSWSLLAQFDRSTAAIQLVEQVVWSSTIGVSYALGVDGLSLPMVLLTTLLVAVALLASDRIKTGVKGYYSWMLVLEFAMLGVFLAPGLDAVLHVLGIDPDPAVFPDRPVGWREAARRQPQFRAVHHGRAIFIRSASSWSTGSPHPVVRDGGYRPRRRRLPPRESDGLLLAFLVGSG